MRGAWEQKNIHQVLFTQVKPTQGYQGRQNRQQIFEIGLKGIEDQSLKTYEKAFEDLSEEEQDAILPSLLMEK